MVWIDDFPEVLLSNKDRLVALDYAFFLEKVEVAFTYGDKALYRSFICPLIIFNPVLYLGRYDAQYESSTNGDGYVIMGRRFGIMSCVLEVTYTESFQCFSDKIGRKFHNQSKLPVTIFSDSLICFLEGIVKGSSFIVDKSSFVLMRSLLVSLLVKRSSYRYHSGYRCV